MSPSRVAELLRFGVAGALSFAVDYSVLVLLTDVGGLHYLLGAAVSFTASVAVNYLICRLWVFQGSGEQDAASKALFIGSSVAGLLLNQLLMWLLVDGLRFDYRIAKLFTTAIVMIWNYIMKRKALCRKG